MSREFHHHTVLITGASRGLGRAAALLFAQQGAHVIATARTRGALEELDDEITAKGLKPLTLLPLDITKGDKVDLLGPSIHSRFQKLDALIHCAAQLGPLTPTHQLDPKHLLHTIDIHALSAQRLIRTLDPLVRQSPFGQFIFVDDKEIAKDGRAYFTAYTAAKAALRAVALAYAAETQKTKINVSLFDPGPMGTELRRDIYPGRKPSEFPSAAEGAKRLLDHYKNAAQSTGQVIFPTL